MGTNMFNLYRTNVWVTPSLENIGKFSSLPVIYILKLITEIKAYAALSWPFTIISHLSSLKQMSLVFNQNSASADGVLAHRSAHA